MLLRAAVAVAYVSCASGCTNLLISAAASETGSPIIAYTADSGGLYGSVRHVAAADHPPGTMRDVWDGDSGKYIGQIPEVEHTYSLIGNTGGMNEHQLAIGETTFGGLERLCAQPGARLDYNTLMTVVLQRCRTAREAIRLIDDLVREHGWYSEGESFSIADTREVWIMEVMGKGPGEWGAVWVARRLPPGAVCSHANQARIQTWPRDDPENVLWANDTVDFAVRAGLYPAGADPLLFSFSDTFCPVDFVQARTSEARTYNILKELADDAGFAARYLDYAQGRNNTNRMPLFQRAKETVTVNASMWLMRTRFTGTWFDERGDIGAGPSHAEYRQRPLVWEHAGEQYIHERTVGYHINAWHFVATPRAGVPDPIGGIIWWGVDDQSLSVRIPLYATATAVPETWREGGNGGAPDAGHRMRFQLRSADWAFNLVANLAYGRWADIYPIVRRRVVETERRLFARVKDTDAAAAAALRGRGGRAAAVAELTRHGIAAGDDVVDEWVGLFGELMVRFRDGLDATLPRPEHPKDLPFVNWYPESGYDAEWYGRIAADTGDHYRNVDRRIDPRLSRSRFRRV